MEHASTMTRWGINLLAAALVLGGIANTGSRAGAAQIAQATPTCAGDRPASLRSAMVPTIPDDLHIVDLMTSASVRIDVAESGDVRGAAIERSTGDARLDDEALRVARLSKFTAATKECQPIPGSYLYEVTFWPDR
jgi:TonB family protein